MSLGTKIPVASFGASRWRGAILIVTAAVGLGGCGSILDVENPNNLIEEELSNPTSAPSLVNGSAGTVARGIGAVLGIYSTAADEATLIGSRDGWRELDIGEITNPRNEFTDDAFRYIAQARWTADEAVKRLEAFDANNRLTDRSQLARAYLYAAVAYITIADMFDDFVFSNGREASPPIGEANMVTLYDAAIGYLDKGLAIAQATKKTELQTQILGVRARAKHARVVWNMLNPKGSIPANPLVNDAGASADAAAALAMMGEDFRFNMVLANDDLAYAGEVTLAYNLFQRRELGIQPVYATLLPTLTVHLNDPITNAPDPVLAATLTTLRAAGINQPITIVSAREMRLILAEAALAQNDMAAFTAQINALRELNDLAPYTGQIPALDLLKHSRRVNLILQGRRLADMYRFGERSANWQASSAAVTTPGTFFPVTCIEIRAHPQDFPGVQC